MADNVTFQDVDLATPPDATVVATDDVGGAHHQKVKVEFGADGTATQVSAADPLPVDASGSTVVTGGLTDTELRATAVPVSGPLTDTQLRATPVPVSSASLPLPAGAATAALQTQPGVDIGDVTVNNAAGAAAVNIQDGGNSITVDGNLAVTGPLTDTQLRASAVPVSAASLPLPSGASTSVLQGGGLPAALAAGGGLKVEGVAGGVAQPISAASLPLPTGAATSALQTQPGVDIGDVTVNNASGASAVNVQDGGNSLTVDSSVKMLYGTEAQALTITLVNLASSATAGRESTAVSNLTDLFTDVMVFAQVGLTSGTIGNDKRCYVWAYGTVDAATPLYPDTVTGSNAAITMNSPTNLRLLGIIECPAQSTVYKSGPWSLAQLFGSVPEKWGIVIQNYTNIALDNTAGNQKVLYQGINTKLA